jgi:hypothetical protein
MAKLGKSVAIRGSKITGKVTGKGFSQKDGKIVEQMIIRIDPKKVTIQDIAPFLTEIVIDSSRVKVD